MELGKFPDIKTKPSRLPTALEFRARLFRLRRTRELSLPDVPDNPTANQMAQYGQVDWGHVDSKVLRSGKPLHRYLHDLARFMITREGYLGTTQDGEPIDQDTPSLHVRDNGAILPIRVKDGWHVGYEGNNRSLILKILGPDFIRQSGMDEWVKIVKE